MFQLPLRQEKRHILHIDADAFFASVEQIIDPSLKGKPVLVGGPSSTRGIVSAASYEARAYGIKSAMPMYLAKKKCPHAVVIGGNFKEYRHFSRRMYQVMQKYTPAVQMMSIDEAYLDITGSEMMHKMSAREIARRILMDIYEDSGLSVSCGMASSKTVAKIASSTNKPHKLTVIPYGQEQRFMAPMILRAMPGIGPRTCEMLERYGFKTLGDLSVMKFDEVLEKFGLHGIPLWKRSMGIDNSPVMVERSLPKSISKEHTFYASVTNPAVALKYLKDMSVRVFGRLRSYGMKAKVVNMKFRYSGEYDADRGRRKFEDLSVQKHLNMASSCDSTLFPVVKDLFWDNWSGDKPLRLVGVGVSKLAENYNLSLFERDEEEDRLFFAMDALKEHYGDDTVRYGA
jgi:DNA polymerase IV